MVLHGDGSAHIFKQDAFKSFASFANSRFRAAGDSNRSIPRSCYRPDACETFDLVVSNPPFGIKLASDTKIALPQHFSLKISSPSEALFLERCFQLLKPNGRLAIVVPESLLNTTDSLETRLLLYRGFWLKTIVALPRNGSIDTPTLTSLLFAQKKTGEQIKEWDMEWSKRCTEAETKLKRASVYLSKVKNSNGLTPSQIQSEFLLRVSPVVPRERLIPQEREKCRCPLCDSPSSR